MADQTTDLVIGLAVLGGAAYAINKGYLGKAIDALLNLKLPSLNLGGSSDNDNPAGGGTGSTTSIDSTVTSNTLWYKANGATANMPLVRCSTGAYGASSGGNSGGNRWENEVNWGNLPGYEVVVYFTIPKGRMKAGESAGHIGLKHGGPNHTSPCDYSTGGSCCCWWDTGLRQTGTVYAEVEHPHPSNIHTKKFGNIGRTLDTGETLGVRWHIMKEGGNVRLIQWVDTSGKVQGNQWKQTYSILDTFDGSLMPADYKSHLFTPKQNIEIRISDVTCHDIKMDYGPVSRQITGTSAYSRAMYAPLLA